MPPARAGISTSSATTAGSEGRPCGTQVSKDLSVSVPPYPLSLLPTEVCLLVVLVLSGLYDCVFFSRAALTQTRVKLTPAQRRLLSVKEGLSEYH